MKKLIAFLGCFLIAGSAFSNDKDVIKSTLNEVTVYSQGAQMKHVASYSIKSGITEVSIEGVSANLDVQSLQVKATGNVVIIDTKYTLFYPQPEINPNQGLPVKIVKDMAAITDSLETLAFDLKELQDEIGIYQAAQRIIAMNGAVKGTGKVNDSLLLLKQTVEYYTVKMNEINKKLLALEKKVKEKTKLQQRLQSRYADLENYQNQNYNTKKYEPIPRVVVTLSANEAATGKINFSYLVASAGWTPLYDIRSDSQTGKISLTYKAQVFQSSGMDWDNVKLNISTNNPFVNKTKPELNAWYIDYYAFKQKNLELNEVAIRGARNIPQAAFNQGYFLNDKKVVEDEPALEADQFTTVVHQLIAAEFKIDLPYSIKSNNEKNLVLIKTSELNTTFKYYSVPKVDPGVYLVAQMTKLDELQLVPASANIFFDGSYIGETYIDPTSMDDTLNLSLGKDPNILVKRTLLKQKSKDKIVQDKRERTLVYQFELQNNKSTSIQVIVQDQLPMTTNVDISIEATEKGNAREIPGNGILEWEYKLKAGENKKWEFGFKVKHPKDQQINM
jgi:uncharacterized protein (TIGR02231 family)